MRRFGSKATAIAAVSIGILLAPTTGCTSRERTTVNASDTYQRVPANPNLVPAKELLPGYEDRESP